MNNVEQLCSRDKPLILDGGLATQLEAMGHDLSNDLWSASLLTSHPEAIVDAHLAYLEAGADCIISASYQASRQGFMSHGLSQKKADELIAFSVQLALEARDEFERRHPGRVAPIVAASVGPYGAVQHDGSEYTGIYSVNREELRNFHAERLTLLDAAGADVLAVETIPNVVEAEVLSELLHEVRTPAWVSFACRNETEISDGSLLADAADLFKTHPNVYALGINCTPPQYVGALIDIVRSSVPDKSVVVYPNSGETYHSASNTWSGTACDLDADFNVGDWHARGATLIGGCCRTGPGDILKIAGCFKG